MSTTSTTSTEDRANRGGVQWYRLYQPLKYQSMASIISRAKQAGSSGAIAMLNTWILSWRPIDMDGG